MSRVSINSNVASLNAQRRLGQSTRTLFDSFTRLSSGLRINRAGDDAAGLAISSQLEAERRVLTQGVRNLNDGVSLLTITEGALSELTSITYRLTELAQQSINGALAEEQREALDSEAQALKDEYVRITRTTEFNGRAVFDQSFGDLRLQAGFGDGGSIVSNIGGAVGTGSLEAATSYAAEGGDSFSVAIADINHDGNLDVVSAGFESGEGLATVRLGDGSGEFSESYTLETNGASTFAMEFVDVNNDSIVDLVAAGRRGSSGEGVVRLGNGDGTFQAAFSFTTEPDRSTGIAVGDINHDGHVDIVTSGTNGASDGYGTILLGTGTGTFNQISTFVAESEISLGIALEDLNGDGVLDMITSGRSDGTMGYATVRLGVGDGSFQAPISYLTDSTSAGDLEIADLNSDGALDILTVGYESGDGSASVLLNQGDGTFGTAVTFATDLRRSTASSLGDINGDGILDLVTSGFDDSLDGTSAVLLGLGDGRFGEATTFASTQAQAEEVALGDLNNDGVLDVAIAGRNDASDGQVAVLLSETVSGAGALLDFDLSTSAGARQALPQFQRRLDIIAEQRGAVGAFESRLNTALNTLRSTAENITAARAQISDVDVAEETANLVRSQILQQAGVAVVAQANQSPALLLELIG